MLTLCIDARMAFSSGIGTYIREIIPLFQGSFRMILLVDELDRSWCKPFEQIDFSAPIYSAQEQILYPIKIPRCDLFWSPHYNVPLLPIRARKKIATLHDACHLVFGSFPEKLYAKFMLGKALKSDRAITVSRFSKKEIEGRIGKGKVEVIPIGVNLSQFTRTPPSAAVRKKYQLPDRFILFVGNQKPHKNIEGLMRAASKLQMELVAVGKGTQRGPAADEDLPALYSMADVFAFPSFYEGFGLPPLEAMGCGCPTAVSKAASIPEVCGDASIYFDPTHVDEIAVAITKAIEAKELLIEKGFERVKLFSWEKSAERHMQIFEEAAHA